MRSCIAPTTRDAPLLANTVQTSMWEYPVSTLEGSPNFDTRQGCEVRRRPPPLQYIFCRSQATQTPTARRRSWAAQLKSDPVSGLIGRPVRSDGTSCRRESVATVCTF